MKGVTREKAMVDRIACPWLIKNFVDHDAEFLFVPADRVLPAHSESAGFPVQGQVQSGPSESRDHE